MTNQDYKEKLALLEKEQSAIGLKIKSLTIEYLGYAPFQPDDVVLVKHRLGESIAYVNYVRADSWRATYTYGFCGVKNDGTRSKKAVYFSDITEITHAPK